MRTARLTLNPAREEEREAAQRLACAAMVRACERSLYELRCALGQARSPADVRSGLDAIDLLAGWRETLAALGGSPARAPQLLPAVHPR